MREVLVTVKLTLNDNYSLSDVAAIIDDLDYDFVHDAVIDTDIVDANIDFDDEDELEIQRRDDERELYWDLEDISK